MYRQNGGQYQRNDDPTLHVAGTFNDWRRMNGLELIPIQPHANHDLPRSIELLRVVPMVRFSKGIDLCDVVSVQVAIFVGRAGEIEYRLYVVAPEEVRYIQCHLHV